MALSRTSRTLALALLAGGAVSCAGGPTSDFPLRGDDAPAAGGGGNGGFTFQDGGSPVGADGSAGEGSTGGATGAVNGAGVTGGAGGGDAGASLDGESTSDGGCLDAGGGDAGDGAVEAATDAQHVDAESDAAPDPCEGAEGGTSAGG